MTYNMQLHGHATLKYWQSHHTKQKWPHGITRSQKINPPSEIKDLQNQLKRTHEFEWLIKTCKLNKNNFPNMHQHLSENYCNGLGQTES